MGVLSAPSQVLEGLFFMLFQRFHPTLTMDGKAARERFEK